MKTETLYSISEDLAALEELLIETGGEVSAGVAEAAIDSWFEELGARRDAKVDSYCALIRNLEARATSRKAEAARLSDRARIDTNAIERLKSRLLFFFDKHSMRSLETARFRISAQANGGVQPLAITQPAESLPDEFVELRREPLKGLIREMLEAGETLPFAELLPRGRSIRIR